MEREREREREESGEREPWGFWCCCLGVLLLVFDIISFTAAVVCRYFVRVVNDLSCFVLWMTTSH